MLFDLQRGDRDADLLQALNIPRAMPPEVRDRSGGYGSTDPDLLGAAVPILGVAGDQQAATIGHACFAPGMATSTYGTGCSMLVNTGERCLASQNRLLTTAASRLQGRTTHASALGAAYLAGGRARTAPRRRTQEVRRVQS